MPFNIVHKSVKSTYVTLVVPDHNSNGTFIVPLAGTTMLPYVKLAAVPLYSPAYPQLASTIQVTSLVHVVPSSLLTKSFPYISHAQVWLPLHPFTSTHDCSELFANNVSHLLVSCAFASLHTFPVPLTVTHTSADTDAPCANEFTLPLK